MARLTRQEQAAIWVLLVLLAGGALGRWWIRQGAPKPAAAAPPHASPGKASSTSP